MTQLDYVNGIIDSCMMERRSELNLEDYEIAALPKRVFGLTWLTRINLSGMGLRDLDSEVSRLAALESLRMDGSHVSSLPLSLGELQSLRELSICFSENLEDLPISLGSLKNLKLLRAWKTGLRRFPLCLQRLTCLNELYIGSPFIADVPEWISELPELSRLGLIECSISQAPAVISEMKGLTSLSFQRTPLQEIPEWLMELTNLKYLSFEATKVTVIPQWVWGMRGLEGINVSGLPCYPERIGKYTIGNVRVTKLY